MGRTNAKMRAERVKLGKTVACHIMWSAGLWQHFLARFDLTVEFYSRDAGIVHQGQACYMRLGMKTAFSPSGSHTLSCRGEPHRGIIE